MEFTKEQLITRADHLLCVGKAFIADHPGYDGMAKDVELFKIALASLEAEPVAWTDTDELRDVKNGGNGYLFAIGGEANKFADPRRQVMLYTAPPAPVVPDEWEQWIADAVEYLEGGLEADGELEAEGSIEAKRLLSRRAAMLHGAEPVTTAYKLPFEQWLSQQAGTIDVECGCVMTEVFFHWLRVAYEAGNSAVIPDGWVMVPVEPTYQMCEAMGLPWESPRFPDRYKAMIAAAPQQEVK